MPAQNEEQNQNQNQNQPNQNESQNQNQSEPLETPTPNTPPVPTNTITLEEANRQQEATHNLYRQALQEAEQRRLASERELETLRRNAQPNQQIPEDQLSPAQLIERAVSVQVAPLLRSFETFSQQQQIGTYQTIKNNFKVMPQLAQVWHLLEPHLDKEMQGKEISVENVQNSLAIVIGRIQMQAAINPQPVNPMPNNQQQQFQQQQPNNQQQQVPQNPNQNLRPPHLQSSAPPLPNRNGNNNLTPGGNARFQLTELQSRVARENKLTHDQYIDLMNETPEGVIHSKVATPQQT